MTYRLYEIEITLSIQLLAKKYMAALRARVKNLWHTSEVEGPAARC